MRQELNNLNIKLEILRLQWARLHNKNSHIAESLDDQMQSVERKIAVLENKLSAHVEATRSSND
jgi:transcription elongation GreA/GreB family factor